jgi:hypothetical protein
MIELHAGQTGEEVIVTLSELQTLDEPYYLFRFEHVERKTVVSVIKSSADDQSDYPARSNKFEFNTSTLFANKPAGFWSYEIYEQASSTNTDPDDATTLLEYGKMKLYPASSFSFEKYNEAQTYKTYQG